GEYVTTLYGDKVTDYELDRLRRHRKLAHEFMGFMLPYQAEVVSKLVDTKPGADTKSPLPAGLREIAQSFAFHYEFQLRRQQFQFPLPPLPQALETIRREMGAVGKDQQQLNAVQAVAAMGATYAAMTRHEPLWIFGGDTSNQD